MASVTKWYQTVLINEESMAAHDCLIRVSGLLTPGVIHQVLVCKSKSKACKIYLNFGSNKLSKILCFTQKKKNKVKTL